MIVAVCGANVHPKNMAEGIHAKHHEMAETMTDEEKRGIAQHFNLELQTARYNMSGSDAELVHAAICKAMEKNWALINAYLVITLVGLVGSYYLTGLWSLAASVVVNVAAFFTGSRMTRDVIIITRMIR